MGQYNLLWFWFHGAQLKITYSVPKQILIVKPTWPTAPSTSLAWWYFIEAGGDLMQTSLSSVVNVNKLAQYDLHEKSSEVCILKQGYHQPLFHF